MIKKIDVIYFDGQYTVDVLKKILDWIETTPRAEERIEDMVFRSGSCECGPSLAVYYQVPPAPSEGALQQ